ncbi:MAG: hypothetical protein ACFFCD_15350 [Promethearchaeota archaeon]
MKQTQAICDICGKTCKNQRGLSIHKGHMHNGKGNDFSIYHLNGAGLINNEILAELYSLRQMIIDLTYKIANNENFMNYEHLQDFTSKRLSSPTRDSIITPQHCKNYMGYGSDHGTLMDELRSVLKDRAPVSA